MLRRLPRGAWPLLGAAFGVAAAVVLTLLQEPAYRADASLVLVHEGRPPASDPELEAAAEVAANLFESRAVAASAIANLGPEETPDAFVERLDAEAEPESSLVRIEVEARDEEAARRAAQQVAEVATVLFNDRFGPRTVASVWEPAEADPERVSPRPGRNLALGALVGALAGWGALLLARRRPRAPSAPEPAAAAALPPPVSAGPVPGPVPGTRPPETPAAPAADAPFVPQRPPGRVDDRGRRAARRRAGSGVPRARGGDRALPDRLPGRRGARRPPPGRGRPRARGRPRGSDRALRPRAPRLTVRPRAHGKEADVRYDGRRPSTRRVGELPSGI